jgi:histone acetyltransferase
MAPERWVGFIKDYDGGTLMDCLLCPAVDYLAVPSMLAAQKEHLLRAVRAGGSSAEVVHPGLSKFAGPGESYMIPGVQAAGFSSAAEAAGHAREGLSHALEKLTDALGACDEARHL